MKIAMIELTGKCPRACPTCLPKHLKSGREMTWGEICALAKALWANKFEGVTLAGFGEPATHPDIERAIVLFREFWMRVQVVCRPEHMEKVVRADILRVSVQTTIDAKKLVANFGRLKRVCGVHFILDNESLVELPGIYATLAPMLGYEIKEMSIACPVVLCDNSEHRETICKANDHMIGAWEGLKTCLPSTLFPKRAELVRLFGPEPLVDKCEFFKGMIYIDSNLKIRPCCHQPVGQVFGDLNKQALSEVLTSKTWKDWQANGKKSPACQRCPDIGDRHA